MVVVVAQNAIELVGGKKVVSSHTISLGYFGEDRSTTARWVIQRLTACISRFDSAERQGVIVYRRPYLPQAAPERGGAEYHGGSEVGDTFTKDGQDDGLLPDGRGDGIEEALQVLWVPRPHEAGAEAPPPIVEGIRL